MELLNRIKACRHAFYLYRYTHMPIKNNKIIMWADSFKHFGCNPKYIALHLLKCYPDQFDIVWVFDYDIPIPEDLPKGIRTVRYFSLEYLRELHTAKFVICNMRTSDAYMWHKRPEQVYIQTWHSSLRLKKIEGDAADSLGETYIQHAKADSAKIDLLVSGCDFSTEIFKRAFWYKGDIAKSGTPRCDILISGASGAKQKVYSYYKLPTDKKLLLYAPTFRKSKKADIHGMDFNALDRCMNHSEHGTWIFGCRLHPNLSEDIAVENVIPMSHYSDMQELLSAADLLITDYSSCMFDMAIAGKPCVLYAPDLTDYIANERGLYFEIDELPFPIARSMPELCHVIETFDMEQYRKNLQQFLSKIGSYEDGHAAQRIADYILKRI